MQANQNENRHEAICPGKLSKSELLTARDKLATQGPEYWRSLQELAGDPEFLKQVRREFPKGASEWLASVSRRDFLSLMAASLALAGMTGCVKEPTEQIIPYVVQPDGIVPGVPKFYATAMTLSGYGIPLLVESHLGRPTKIEGNPQHPASLGGSDVFSQASLLDLYDPDRSQAVTFNGEISSWFAFIGAIRASLLATPGQQIRFLTQSVSSPTLTTQIQALLSKYPNARWHQWEPVNRDTVRAGAKMAFGEYVETQYRFSNAEVILSVDADFLYPTFPGFHRYTREWANRRRPTPQQRPFADVAGNLFPDYSMNRLYALESTPTVTGAKAEHKLKLRPSEIARYLNIIASRLGIDAGGGSAENDSDERWLNALVSDLKAHRGTGLIIAGDSMPAEIHALAHALNESLGNAGQTVIYTDPVLTGPMDQTGSIQDLVREMKSGKVDMLFILGGNPVYDAPADLEFSDALKRVAIPIYHGHHSNETAAICHWQVNAAHYLEAWSDVRAYDGTASIVQPLISPLYHGKSEHELLAVLTDNPEQSGYKTVRDYWNTKTPKGTDFEDFWRESVYLGLAANTTLQPRNMRVKVTRFAPPQNVASGTELIIRPDPSIYDGRFANNGWLQEVPKPLTELTWDNPVMIGLSMAKRLGLNNGSVIEIEFQSRKIVGATWIQPGHPDNALTVFLGYGRERCGRVGSGVGYNAYPLRTSGSLHGGPGVTIRNLGRTYKLITGQGLQDMENRDLVREATLDEYKVDPEFAHRNVEEPSRQETLYPNFDYTGYAWGMLIDQNACVGCNACVIACQSENNIAVVGKLQVAIGRRMHWLRVDAYYKGDPDNPKAFFQPVPCMQCENAPCELVCPVEATVHSTEGLNDMIYNRCVGTRYCSNNCPYKVRRFNFLLFQDWTQPQYKLMRNPEVSVRSRGVMEKCTYCVQRITKGRIQAEEEQRLIRDGEVQTACQQACPADAIIFGNINDPNSRVSRLKENPRNYGLLADMNTRPRTTYLALVHNPNPQIPETAEQHNS
ncbi:MAG TPA: TAT-variant-translocated molybdopterin oxidoreductase [Verrucomicrobiae bacterium]|jgi:MoCo/4Fe-4S cofactor protein with predicted Tat translocation signal|nr:TAT-variant-translocated molybdopterin oxidoreductase [Verrucomicrobiae bacterium]